MRMEHLFFLFKKMVGWYIIEANMKYGREVYAVRWMKRKKTEREREKRKKRTGELHVD